MLKKEVHPAWNRIRQSLPALPVTNKDPISAIEPIKASPVLQAAREYTRTKYQALMYAMEETRQERTPNTRTYEAITGEHTVKKHKKRIPTQRKQTQGNIINKFSRTMREQPQRAERQGGITASELKCSP